MAAEPGDDRHRFEAVDWEHLDDGRRRPSPGTVAFLAFLALEAVAFGYDLLVLETEETLFAGWNVTALDWLFVPSIVAFVLFVIAPLLSDRERLAVYWRQLRGDRLAIASLAYLVVFALVGALGPLAYGVQPNQLEQALQPPVLTSIEASYVGNCLGTVVDSHCYGSVAHPLGTTQFGRDMVWVLVAGARVALQVALITSMLIVPIATAVGTVAGYVGGRVDDLLMRYVDIQQTVPAFLVYIILVFVFGRSLFMLILVFGLLSWGGVARLVRSDVLQLKEEGYVLAAESAGAGPLGVIRYHLLPNTSKTVLTATTREMPALVLAEAAIAFMNLNDMTVPSWGESISKGFQSFFPQAWWLTVLPVVALALTAVAFSVLGDALRDAMDPRESS